MKKENQVPENQIKPHLVTKPIQLLATWLLGLTIVNSSFLTAADYITSPEWAPGALVIAAICYVPLFLISLFLLQTKFRPEMQEDSYYSDYLRNKNSDTANKINEDDIKKHAEKLAENIIAALKLNGLLFYQTFIKENVTEHGPSSPNYRLGENELLDLFAPLHVLAYQELGCVGDVMQGMRGCAMLVAQKR